MEHSFRAAVFDLDGTLLDTLQDLGACADEALRQYGFPGHTMEEYRSYIGNGIPRLIARAVPEGTSEQDIQKVLNLPRLLPRTLRRAYEAFPRRGANHPASAAAGVCAGGFVE